MGWGIVWCIVLISIASADLNCTEPYYSASRPVQCQSFGDVHFLTFDGLGYNFQGYGEFWLVNKHPSSPFQDYLQVQTRMIECGTTPMRVSTDGAGLGATCNRAFAIRSVRSGIPSDILEFIHDPASNSIDIYIAGELANPSSMFTVGTPGQLAKVMIESHDGNGYGARVEYMFGSILAHVIEMNFFATPQSATILITPALSTIHALTGLCGFYDTCPNNDLMLRPNDLLTILDPDLKSDGVVFEGTVDLVSEMAGVRLLLPNATERQIYDFFGASWQVLPTETLFTYKSGENYEILNYSPANPPKDSTHPDCTFPGYSVPKFLVKSCVYDTILTGKDTSPVARELLISSCQYYCDNGFFPNPSAIYQPKNCFGICGYTAGDVDLHARYDSTNLPPITLRGATNRRASFQPTNNLGGIYVFNIQAIDLCGNSTTNVTVNIKCDNRFTLSQIGAGKDREVPRGWYGWPSIIMEGTAPADSYAVSWKIMDWPGRTDELPTLAPIVEVSQSRHGRWTPLNEGTHIVEFAVFDGCSIVRINVTVNATCGCAPLAFIDAFPLKTVTWRLSNPYNDTDVPQPMTSYEFPDLQPTSTSSFDADDADGILGYNWYLVADNDPSTFLVLSTPAPGVKTYTRYFYYNRLLGEVQQIYPEGQIIDIRQLPEALVQTVTGSPSVVPPPIMHLPQAGPNGGPYGIFPLALATRYQRDATEHFNETLNVYESRIEMEYIQSVSIAHCEVEISGADTATPTISTRPLLVSTMEERFVSAIACIGEFLLAVNVSEERACRASTDIEAVEIACGPVPQVELSCPTYLEFDYAAFAFTPARIDGSLSSDPLGRDLGLYMWSFVSKPTMSVLEDDDLCNSMGTDGCLSSSSVFTPDIEGSYIIQLVASSGCSTASQIAQLTTTCPIPASDINPTFTASNLITGNVLAYDGVNTLRTAFDASTSTSVQAEAVGGYLKYNYSFVRALSASSPAIPTIYPIPNATLVQSDPTNPLADLTVYYPGDYIVTVTVTHGCGHQRAFTDTIHVECRATLVASAGPDQVVTFGSGAVVLDGSNSTFTSVVYTPSRFYVWRWVDVPATSAEVLNLGVDLSNSAIYTFVPDAVGVFTARLLISDGCNWEQTVIRVTVNCNNLQAVILPVPSTAISATAIALASNSSSVTPILSYLWQVTTYPANADPSNIIANANSANATFTPLASGNYVVQLVVNEGCRNSSATVSISITCPDPLVATAQVTSTSLGQNGTGLSLAWSNSKWPRLDLNGNPSNIGNRNSTSFQFSYQWRVIAAPTGSIFEPRTDVSTMIEMVYNDTGYTLNPGGQNYSRIVTNTTRRSVTTRDRYVVLTNSFNPPDVRNAVDKFPSCFYPDLAGNYQLQLSIFDGCKSATSTVTVSAVCNNPPAVNLSVTAVNGEISAIKSSTLTTDSVTGYPNYTYVVTLDKNYVRRLALNASQSMDPDAGDLLFYEWSWAAPDPRAGTIHGQEGIDRAFTSAATVVLTAAGTYHYKVQISDGCSRSWALITIVTQCTAGEAVKVADSYIETTFRVGRPETPRAAAFSLIAESQCAENRWKLVDYVPIGQPSQTVSAESTDGSSTNNGAIAGGVLGGIFGALALFVAIYFGRRLCSKRGGGGASGSSSQPQSPAKDTQTEMTEARG